MSFIISSVLIQFVDLHGLVEFHHWCLDDETFGGSRSSLLDTFSPQFGLHLNMS